MSREEIPRHVQELEVSSRGPTVRETPGQFVVVHLNVDEMLHPTKAVGEWPGKLIPLHGNRLDVAQLHKAVGESSLDCLPVQIYQSNLFEVVAGNPGPRALVHGAQPPIGWDCASEQIKETVTKRIQTKVIQG